MTPSSKWFVQHRDELSVCWGPFDSEEIAKRFADWAASSIDPVVVRWLREPLREILSWQEREVLGGG